MNDDYWKERIDRLEIRLLEKSRECAHQHVALGQLMDVVANARNDHEDHQSPDLLARFEAVLKPYASWFQRFHQAEWALQDRKADGPSTGEVR